MNFEYTDIIKYIIELFFLVIILKEASIFIKSASSNMSYTFSVWKKFSAYIFIQCILLMGVTGLVGYFLNKIPFLSYGWYRLLVGENSNAVISLIDTDGKNLSSFIFTSIIIGVLLILLPHFSKLEETIFRKDKLSLSERIKSSIAFGLLHCTMGVSLGIGLAMIIPGYFFSIIYKRNFYLNINNGVSAKDSHDNALERSTLVHTQYNTILFTFLYILVGILFYANNF